MAAIPRATQVVVDLPPGEWLHITPLSDLHIESAHFNDADFQRLMNERNKLPNHRALLLGDVMDLVVPRDLKRWRPSVQDKRVAGRDDWINAGIDLAVERLTASGTVYDLVIPGNHEDEMTKRHGIDVTSILAHRLGCARGGYSGYVQYALRQNGKVRVQKFTVAYHHGAWGGRVMKGFGGARDYFRGFDGWHVCLYGHNHQQTVHRENRVRLTKNGASVTHYPVYYVCTGSWVESYSDDAKTTHYAERAGHMPTSQHTPLIKVRPFNGGSGRNGWQLDYAVET
jgi:UDP-2,3-diacylglucosamine pyrophosphatase LpxH